MDIGNFSFWVIGYSTKRGISQLATATTEEQALDRSETLLRDPDVLKITVAPPSKRLVWGDLTSEGNTGE